MFRSGDDALQALCDGCNSRRLHHLSPRFRMANRSYGEGWLYTIYRAEGEADDPRALEARESRCKSGRRDQFHIHKS